VGRRERVREAENMAEEYMEMKSRERNKIL
jgi:hypothetical protein